MNGSSTAALVVCIEFVPPSVKHVAHLVPLLGNSCVAQTFRRVQKTFAGELEYHALCWLEKLPSDVRRELEKLGVSVFETDEGGIGSAFRAFWRANRNLEFSIIATGNTPLLDCYSTRNLVRMHRESNAYFSCVRNAPSGLMPLFLARPWPEHSVLNRASTVDELVALLHRGPEMGQVAVYEYGSLVGPDAPLEELPVSVNVVDEPSRLAAEQSLSTCGEREDYSAARIFKKVRLAFDLSPSPARKQEYPSAAPRAVMFWSPRLDFRGADSSLLALIANLDRDRFRPIAVFSFESRLAESLRGQGITTEVAGWDFSKVCPCNLSYCEDLFKRYRPDIVHIDCVPNAALMVTARFNHACIVGHLRSLMGTSWPSEAYLAEKIVTVSDAIARDARRNNVLPQNVIRIYNGVDADTVGARYFDRKRIRAAKRIPVDATVISIVGKITATKNLDLLVDALPNVVSSVPSIHVAVVGEQGADSGYCRELESRIVAAGLRSYITWWGFEEQIGRVYAASDVLVHCNANEGLARCMLESCASGCPIVAPDAGGSPEIVEHGLNGLLYEANSAASLASALIEILSSEPLRERLAQGALVKANVFSIARHVKEIENLYDTLLAEKRPRACASTVASR